MNTNIVENETLESALEVFGQRLKNDLQTQLNERRPIEQRWVKNMRQYKSMYEDAKKKAAEKDDKSTVFVGYTRSKTDSWVAQMTDMLFPADDKNYGISPTPVPDLEKKLEQDPNFEGDISSIAKAIRKEAKHKATAMESEIDDQLLECDYAKEARWMLHYAGILGTGILRAPEVKVISESRWVEAEEGTGAWTTEIQHKKIPVARCVYPWDFVPDMSATCLDDSEFLFERSYQTKKDLRALLKDETKHGANIKKLLEGDAKTTHAHTGDVLGYVNQLREMIGLQATYKESRYEIWTYTGPIPASVLEEAQIDIGEDIEEYMEVDGLIEFAGDGTIIGVNINPLDTQDWTYSVYCCEPDVSCIFGYGIPDLIEDAQDIINTAWRGMIDNGVSTIGDQIVVNKTVLEPADGNWSFSPNKVWKTTGSAGSNAQFEAQKAFGVFSMQSRQTEFANMIQMAKSFMDEESGLPMIAQGEQGQVTPTLGGMSMLMNAATAVRRRQVKEFDDDVTKPVISRFYAYNMQFSQKTDIKGDMNVVARGTSALLVKEIQSAQFIEMYDRFANHPYFKHAFDWYVGAEAMMKSMSAGVKDMLKTREEFEEALKKEQEANQNNQDPVVMKAQMELELQQMKHENAVQLQEMKSAMTMHLEEMKMSGTIQSQELRNREMLMKHELETTKVKQAGELRLMELSMQEKWNTEKLVTELRKLQNQQEVDMNKFLAEMKLKQGGVPQTNANFGLE